MKILIPDSESKNPGGTHPPQPLSKQTLLVLKAIDAYPKKHVAKLYGVKGEALEHAITTNSTIAQTQTLPAIQRFNGVVYDGLSYDTLTAKQKAFAHKHLHIMTSVFGLVRCTDLITDYKLSITKLNVSAIQQTRIMDDFVIDLLPKSHTKAVWYDKGVRVEFILLKDGHRIPAGHNGKLIKGKFCRFIIENQFKKTEQLLQFDLDGFIGTRVTERLIEFTKEI